MNLCRPPVSFREQAGRVGAMGKLIFDNRFVGVVFVLLLFVNAYAITNGWYA
ncbi:hypothetical protein Pve01_89740 [Planomonospora venezuelensis]|nr:hypothetical protein Pve01_89740 [Planomonospora venezuelensis]